MSKHKREKFNDRLRFLRIVLGCTQKELAEELHLSLRAYQRYEGGQREPDLALLVEIADIFDVPTDFLLGRDDFLIDHGVTIEMPIVSPRRQHSPFKE